ncbi:Ig-like domain-containing protein [Pseudochryseolinea flava]|uniref:Ig-like domain-containing protein n=1 Tax=Pseudochryseolinea flava TaxID=2059302 RepID=A0A364Y338_9BACT|nr:DUF6443 domain-containing protein [Pseudochryseolinea flava]RAW01109.1 hypothetical protein DQQ10_12840 [Pseudochryseolinea flava]
MRLFISVIITFCAAILLPIWAKAQCGTIQGLTTALTGETKNYSYCYNSGAFTSAQWTVTKGTLLSSSLSSDGTTAFATVRWDVQGTGTLQLRDGVVLQTKNITINCSTLPTPTYSPASPYVCGNGALTLTASGGTGNTVRWFTAQTGGTQLAQASAYTTPTISSTTSYYIATYNTTSTCSSSPRVQITVTTNPIPGVPAVTGGSTCVGSSATLSATPGTNGTQIKWFDAPTNGNLLFTGTTFTTPPLMASATYYAATYNAAGTCSSARIAVQANIVAATPYFVEGGPDDVIYGAGSLTITLAAGPGGNNVRWYDVPTGGTMLYQGSTFTTPTLTASKTYYAVSYNSSLNCESMVRTPIVVTVIPFIIPSSLKQEIVRVENIKTESQLTALNNTQKVTSITYLDGLSRPKQQVAVAASTSGNDIVQPVEFDAFGRTPKTYLPYVASTNDGSFKTTYVSDQLSFYADTLDEVADDPYPYAVAKFERSPSGRLKEQGGIGNGFQPGQGHTQKLNVTFNTGATNSEAEEVRLLKSDGSSAGYYGANLLLRAESTDGDGSKQIVFTDKAGRVLVKKQELGETINSVMVNYLQTYYIYDDFDRIRYIITPKGVDYLRTNGWPALNATLLNRYAHQFVYDNRGRIVEKKVPGQDWMYYVYDKQNRLVLTQDGMLRTPKKWMFIKYDFSGRPVMQGLYYNATQTTRTAIQAMVDGLYIIGNASYPETARAENRGTTLHGYTNVSFPKINSDNSALEILSVNYYDHYDFDFNGTADRNYQAQGWAGEGQPFRARGLPTGSKRIILGTSNWLYNYVFYDKYSRVIQVHSNNHLSPTIDNITTNLYDYTKLIKSKTYHNAGSGRVATIENSYSYDPQGRLVGVSQNNNDGLGSKLLVAYTYNALGQMVDQKLHNTGGSNFLQSVDYRYTIQGAIASINNAGLDVASNNDDVDDYFGMEFLYQTVASGMNNTARYNGNVSAIKWKGIGAKKGSDEQRSYSYSYDKSGKLKDATYKVSDAAGWTKESNALNESTTYDHNGNLKSLKRNQRKGFLALGSKGTYISESIDDLTYEYSTTVADQLLKVTDATTKKEGFDNGGSAANSDFSYDVNGNLLTDNNKGITSNITYNFFGKPTQITYTDGRKLEYVYDAGGSKLSMKLYEGTTLKSTTDYVGGFVYENETLSFFAAPGGRVVKKGNTYEHQYAIADHQGNTRVLFTSATPAQHTLTATFEGAGSDSTSRFGNLPTISPSAAANHTAGGSRAIRMNKDLQLAMTKSLKVYPGDEVDLEVYSYHEGNSGFGTLSASTPNLITAIATAFGGVNGAPGESGMIYNGVNTGLNAIPLGGNEGDDQPAAYLNYFLFDKNYNMLDLGFKLVDATTWQKNRNYISDIKIKEAGYMFVFLSYDNIESANFVYFDDLNITLTKSNVIQYNDYYPFGLEAATSWTRENNSNSFLYNAGNELNKTSGWYEMFYRGYDPALGRMLQVDPYATSFASSTPYNYALNSPVMGNDPSGGYAYMSNNFGREMIDARSSMLEGNGWAISMTPSEYGSGAGGGGMYAVNTDVFGYSHEDLYGRNPTGMAAKMMAESRLSNMSASQKFEYGNLVGAKMELWSRWRRWTSSDGTFLGEDFLGYFWKESLQQNQPKSKTYSVGQFIEHWEIKHGRPMTPEEKKILASGCIGITSLELGRNRDPVSGAPRNELAYSSFEKALAVAASIEKAIDDSAPGTFNENSRVIIYSVRFWARYVDGFQPDKNGRVDMGGFDASTAGLPGYVSFDFGLYDSSTGKWWHANHSEPGMKVYESTLSHFSRKLADFNRQVFVVAITTVKLK